MPLAIALDRLMSVPLAGLDGELVCRFVGFGVNFEGAVESEFLPDFADGW